MSPSRLRGAGEPVPIGESPGVRLPALLVAAAAWSWRLVAVAGAVVLLFWFLGRLTLLVVPFLGAMLLTALLRPAVMRLRRGGVPAALATTLVIVNSLVVLGGTGTYVVQRAVAEYPALVEQLGEALRRASRLLERSPLRLRVSTGGGPDLTERALDLLRSHQTDVATGAVAAGRTFAEVLTAALLTLFLTVFLVHDGDAVWTWLTRLLPRTAQPLVHEAGVRAWRTLSHYIVGTVLIASFHGVVVAVTLGILRVPLVAPLTVLVFLGSFIPVVGATLFGALALLVTFVSAGPVAAVVLLVVLVVDNQVEAHVLQPLVVGRYVRLHPVAVAVVLTAGALLAGLVGAVFAVPLVSMLVAGARYLAGEDDDPPPLDGASPEQEQQRAERAEAAGERAQAQS